RSGTMVHKVRLVNSYALSNTIYYMRVALIPGHLVQKIYELVKRCLSNVRIKIAIDRLVIPKDKGGYGLLDLVELNYRMLRTWLLYLKVTPRDYFTTLVDTWNETIKKKYDLKLGPLLSYKSVIFIGLFWEDL